MTTPEWATGPSCSPIDSRARMLIAGTEPGGMRVTDIVYTVFALALFLAGFGLTAFCRQLMGD